MAARHHAELDKKFRLSFIINSSFMVFEFIIGFLTGSLILIADAAHNLTDSITLVISWAGNRFSQKPADHNHSLGHGRISVVAAFVNSVILVLMAIAIFFEAYQRFLEPQTLEGSVIALIGAVGIVANGTVAWLFRKNRDDLNVNAAFTNMLFDALFSIAALIAGVLIAITHKTWIDPLISIGVGVGLLYAAYGILRQATHIFLEGVPKDVDIQGLTRAIEERDDVDSVVEFVAWALSSNEYIACCAVTLPGKNHVQNMQTTARIKQQLHRAGFSKVFIELQ